MFSQINSLTISLTINSGAFMSEEPENSETKRIDSLEDADNKESNRQLIWTLGAMAAGFLIIVIIYL